MEEDIGNVWQISTETGNSGWSNFSTRNFDNVPVLFAYDPASGAAHKTFSMEMPGFRPGLASGMPVGFIPGLAIGIMPAACDMNGDGRDEIIISNNTGVFCIGYKDLQMSVLWKYSATDCSPGIIADIDSDGFVEVIIVTHGKILVIDK